MDCNVLLTVRYDVKIVDMQKINTEVCHANKNV